jgi:hypothetical protein
MFFTRPTGISQPDDPSYQGMLYRELSPRWEYLWDMFMGTDNWLFRLSGGDVSFGGKVRVYLPPEQNEPDMAYRSRVLMSLFDRRFARSVRIYTDLVLHDYYLDIPKGSTFDPGNVDRHGTPFYNFWAEVAINALVFGHTFVLVDKDPGNYRSELERRERGKPFLVSYSPLDLINWRVDDDGVKLAVFREMVVKPVGDYGEEAVTRYRVLRPNRWELWEGETGALQKVDGGALRGIPLVCIYSHQIGPFMSDPPLKTLADLNLAHYQLSSDHRQKLHKCCLPTPVRIGTMTQGTELVLGPNTFVDLPDGGDFKWAEPLAMSLGESRLDIESLERTIDLYGFDYLSKGIASGRSRATALETGISVAPAEATLSGFARRFEHGMQTVLKLWASMAVESMPIIQLSGKLKMQKLDPQMLIMYVKLAESNGISKRTLLKMLIDQDYLPKDFDIDAELFALASYSEVRHYDSVIPSRDG